MSVECYAEWMKNVKGKHEIDNIIWLDWPTSLFRVFDRQDRLVIVCFAGSDHKPQEEGMNAVCDAYDKFHHKNPPIPSHFLRLHKPHIRLRMYLRV